MAEDTFFNIEDRSRGIPRDLAEGMTARVYPGDQAMISIVTIDPNRAGRIHSHPEEQWGLCIRGSGVRVQDGVEHPVEAGDFWRSPGGVEHGSRAGPEGAVIYDVFAPPRDDYRTAGGGFGAAADKGEA